MTPEKLQALGFQNMEMGRWALITPTRCTLIFVSASNQIWCHGNPLVNVESEEHLRDILQALRAIK